MIEQKLSICETCFYGYWGLDSCNVSLPDYIPWKQVKLYRQKLRKKSLENSSCRFYERYLITADGTDYR